MKLAGLFYHRTIVVGVVGGLLRGAMSLAGPIQDCIQLGWTVLVAFRGPFLRPGLLITESGVYDRLLIFVVVVVALVLIPSGLPIPILDF